jgi:hypothetical protein
MTLSTLKMNAIIITNQIYSNIVYDNSYVITNDNKFIIREKLKNYYSKMQLISDNVSGWYNSIQKTLPVVLKNYRNSILAIKEQLKILVTEYEKMLDDINVLIGKIQYLSNDIEDIAYKKILLVKYNKSINDCNNVIKKKFKQLNYYNKKATQYFNEVIN